MSNHDLQSHQEFYDQRWIEKEALINTHQAHRLAQIIRAMVSVVEARTVSDYRICDLGCGVGWLANELKPFGAITGVDLSPEGINLARSRWPGITFEVGNVLEYSSETPFDLVINLNLLMSLRICLRMTAFSY